MDRAERGDIVHGALAGAIGAACMTPLRLGARRLGLVDKMVPQAMEETLASKLRGGPNASLHAHHVADQLLHLGFGATLGLGYALVTARRRAQAGGRGLLFGVLAWALGSGVVIPLMGAARPLWRARPVENLVNLTAHLVYGATTALVLEELSSQPAHPHARAARGGHRVG
jgi:hypothetical protein